VTRSGPIAVSISAEDADHDTVTFQYRWYVNDNLVPEETAAQFPPEKIRRGDRLRVEITPSDGRSYGSAYKTQSVQVVNTLPFVAKVGLPEQLKPGDTAKVDAEIKDADDDEVRALYRWWKNQDLVAETEVPSLDTTGFNRGDVLKVTVIPRDATGQGKEISSPPIDLGNSPPRFTSKPLPVTDGKVYQYLITAVDPEGDQVSYELETAPPGMTLDQTSGQVSWVIPSGLTGAYRVRVVAKDGQGMAAFQEFELTPPPSATPS
jgi:hypothetical protein